MNRERGICAVRGSSLLGNAGKQRGFQVGCGQKRCVHDCFGFTTMCIIGKSGRRKIMLTGLGAINLREQVSTYEFYSLKEYISVNIYTMIRFDGRFCKLYIANGPIYMHSTAVTP